MNVIFNTVYSKRYCSIFTENTTGVTVELIAVGFVCEQRQSPFC